MPGCYSPITESIIETRVQVLYYTLIIINFGITLLVGETLFHVT